LLAAKGSIKGNNMFAEEQCEIEKIIKATWQNWEGDATEKITLRETKEGIFVESIITNAGQESFIVRYTIFCDASWRVRKFEIESTEKKERLRLESDGLGRWSNNSIAIAELNGAIDIDITATPFTNALPLKTHRERKKRSWGIGLQPIKSPPIRSTVAIR